MAKFYSVDASMLRLPAGSVVATALPMLQFIIGTLAPEIGW
jgi:hypothetical protein